MRGFEVMKESNTFQSTFDNCFKSFCNQPIAIYGTGNNAELILKNIKGYDFIYVISNKDIGSDFFGKKIVSLEKAIEVCTVIIIAAIPSSTNIVFNRICDIVPKDISIFDMRGNRLDKENFGNNPYWNKSIDELYEQIKAYEVISFDIFDTLVQRTVLELGDLFNLIQTELQKQGINMPFSKWRREAEDGANREKTAPSLEDIYFQFQKDHNLDIETICKMRNLEYGMDREIIRPRNKIVKAFNFASENNKIVIFTSDMYYSSSQIKEILKKCGIDFDGQVLISSEIGADKVNGGLYDELIKIADGRSILHIGDNFEVDYLNAQKKGIDSFWIMSHYNLLCYSSIGSLVDYDSGNNRNLLGLLSSELFNDPFCICETKGKVNIDSYDKLAAIFLPITLLFLNFIRKYSKEYDVLLFPSRDGFLLYELYRCITKNTGVFAKGVYFYASRSGISSAVVKDADDLDIYCSKLWSDKNQNVKKFLENQFQIEVDENLNHKLSELLNEVTESEVKEKILELENRILHRSEINRKNYDTYIRKLNIDKSLKIAVVDIVTHGTLLKGISDLIERDIDLIALGTSAVPNKYIQDETRVKSVYGNVNEEYNYMLIPSSDLSELHLLIEVLYSSRDGQFLRFDDNSNPIFMNDSAYDKKLLDGFQNSIIKLVRKSYRDELIIDKDFALNVLNTMRGEKSSIADEIKKRFIFDDPYDESNLKRNILQKINGGDFKLGLSQ